MDIIVFYNTFCRFCPFEYFQAGSTFSDSGSSASKPMVHPSCNCIYVFLFFTWVCLSDWPCGTYKTQFLSADVFFCRHPGVYRTSFYDIRNAVWCHMGQGCLGTFLELGSEGNLGLDYMVGLSYVYTLENIS